MSSRSRSTGSSERSSTDSPIQEELSYWSVRGLLRLSYILRFRSPNGTGRMSSHLGPTSRSLLYLSLPSLQTTGLFSHPSPTGHQFRLEQESWWKQGRTDSTPGTQARRSPEGERPPVRRTGR